MRALGRSLDWASTALGPVEQWPGILRDTVRTCLDSPFPINLWCGPELVLIYNDAYRQVLGAKHPAALGRPGSEVWSEIWPDVEPMFEQIRAGGPPVFFEDAPFVVRREPAEAGPEQDDAPDADTPASSGPNAWFTFSLSGVRDESGEIVAYLNVVSESTGRVMAERAREIARAKAERAEARLRDVFAQAPAFMAVVRGPRHVFEYVNQAYYQLVGHRALLGRPVLEALPELEGQGFDGLLDGVLATGEPFVGREVAVDLVRSPGEASEQRFVDVVYYPINEPDGTRSGVVAHGSDVTDHVLARREAQRARVVAERASRAKSQFLATMSHEIRTPINAVMGYADLLDAAVAGSLTDQQQTYVDGIQASSRHLLGLISEILDLAKIEAGEMTVATGEVPLRPAVRRALQIIAPQAQARELRLTEEWGCSAEATVVGDDDRLRQILLNLLSNALKFTEAGGTITVRCRETDAAPADAALPELGPWVVVTVEDTGQGIPPDQLSRIFDPFIQAEAGHTRRAGGTGLGLTISRRLARLMGGDLTVRSQVGEGSCFALWLPPVAQERVALAPAEVDAAAVPPVDRWPPDPAELPGLAATGRTLLSLLDQVESMWVERLVADARIDAAGRVSRPQVADQTAELVAAMAKTLFILEEGEGDPSLLDDAEAIQDVVARRHGQQRRRLGWDRDDVRLEYQVLGEVLEEALRREAPKRTAADLDVALSVVHRLVARAVRASLAAYDRADE